MPIVNLEYPKFRALDGNGDPLSLGKVEIFLAGTTTQATTYTDAVRTSQNTNPVILSSAGEAEIWFDVAVDVEITDSSDVLQDKILGLAANLSPTVTGNLNLILNGSFETDEDADTVPDNWTVNEEVNGVIAIDSTVQAHGHNSLKFDGGGSGGGTATSTMFDALTGGDVAIQFTYRSTTTTTTNAVQINWYDKDDAKVGATIDILNAATGHPLTFTTYNYEETVPATAIQGELIITGVSSGGGDLSEATWFDDVQVFSIDAIVTKTATQTLTSKTLTSPVFNTGVSGTAIETTLTNTATKVPASSAVYDKVAGLNVAVYDIGDWNMDTGGTKSVTHGLTFSKIRSVNALIRNDADSFYYSLYGNGVSDVTSDRRGSITITPTIVNLLRTTGGEFDNTGFDSTSFNRGWVTVQYTD